MKMAIGETPEISEQDVVTYIELWKAESAYKKMREDLVARFKGGAVCPSLENGISLVFSSAKSTSTSYQKVINEIKGFLVQRAGEGDVSANQLIGFIEQWQKLHTKEGERNTITPKAEQVVTVTKAVKIGR